MVVTSSRTRDKLDKIGNKGRIGEGNLNTLEKMGKINAVRPGKS
jgi:hypothetical protein